MRWFFLLILYLLGLESALALPNSGESYHIVNVATNRCLTVNSAGRVVLGKFGCEEDPRWVTKVSSNGIEFIWDGSGKCMGVGSGALRNEAIVAEYDCNDGIRQRFKWDPSSHKLSMSGGSNPSFCVDIAYNANREGAKIIIYACHGHANQQWIFSNGSPAPYSWDNYIQPKLNSSITYAVNELENSCQSFRADTKRSHAFEVYDHHQSLEVSHAWSDGSRSIFISHSEHNKGEIMSFAVPASAIDQSWDIFNKNAVFPLQSRIWISEKHPSGMAWLPAPTKTGRDRGYLLIASEKEKKLRVREFGKNGDLGHVGVLKPIDSFAITDVWVAVEGGYHWVILHGMNADSGVAYRASTHDLFQYGTENEGKIDLSALKFRNTYTSPSNTGCGKSLGQNAQLVQDEAGDWYVVHSFTDAAPCGDNFGNNVVKAYPAAFKNGRFSVSTSNTPTVQEWVGFSASVESRGADGAAGFRVNKFGRLVALFGAQYSHLAWTSYRSRLEECRSPN